MINIPRVNIINSVLSVPLFRFISFYCYAKAHAHIHTHLGFYLQDWATPNIRSGVLATLTDGYYGECVGDGNRKNKVNK